MNRPAQFVFLDFDGVLHPVFPYYDEDVPGNHHFRDAPAFEAVLRAHPDVQVVISSSWRQHRSLDALRAKFSPDFGPRIVGKTPDPSEPHGTGSRQREIEAWLRAQGHEGAPWVAVDDAVFVFSPGACVVETGDGFGPREAALLTEALADPAAYALAHPLPAPWPQPGHRSLR